MATAAHEPANGSSPGSPWRAADARTQHRPGMSMRVATVSGIQIRIHATFLVLVALVAVTANAEEGPGLTWGLIWLVALFSCVVVHELAHSLVARRFGIPVLEIELLPFGGISKMGRSPQDPGVELRIALAGPLASVGLGAAFAWLALLAGASMWPPTLYGGGFLARLAWVNLLLAGFNLVPALPLDGGRVLRATLEQRSDRDRATRVAARAGRLFAVAMIAAGLLFNLWLLVIGLFVYAGSWAEEAAALLHACVKELHVSDVMVRDPMCVSSATPVEELVADLWRTAQREFPVVGADGACEGVVTADALLRAAPHARVGALADARAVLAPDDPLETCGLLTGEIGAAAVVSGGQVVGLARAADTAAVVRQLLRQGAQAVSDQE